MQVNSIIEVSVVQKWIRHSEWKIKLSSELSSITKDVNIVIVKNTDFLFPFSQMRGGDIRIIRIDRVDNRNRWEIRIDPTGHRNRWDFLHVYSRNVYMLNQNSQQRREDFEKGSLRISTRARTDPQACGALSMRLEPDRGVANHNSQSPNQLVRLYVQN